MLALHLTDILPKEGLKKCCKLVSRNVRSRALLSGILRLILHIKILALNHYNDINAVLGLIKPAVRVRAMALARIVYSQGSGL